jgi:hypothetical protein
MLPGQRLQLSREIELFGVGKNESQSQQAQGFAMNTNPVETQSIEAETEDVSFVDLEGLAELIRHELHDQVDNAEIYQLLVDLLPKYQEARILTYVPVLMRREAIEILRRRSP